MPEAISDAVSEHALQTIGEPDVQLDTSEGPDKFGQEPISVRVSVEVLPEIELGQYRELELSRRVRPVNDTDVDNMVDGLRESSASLCRSKIEAPHWATL